MLHVVVVVDVVIVGVVIVGIVVAVVGVVVVAVVLVVVISVADSVFYVQIKHVTSIKATTITTIILKQAKNPEEMVMLAISPAPMTIRISEV